MTIAKFNKTPLERIRYVLDYSDWLDTGETIVHVGYSVAPNADDDDLFIDATSIATDKVSAVFFANGGKNGTSYKVSVSMTSSGGQLKRDQVAFNVKSLP